MRTLIISTKLRNLLTREPFLIKGDKIFIDVPEKAKLSQLGNYFDIFKGVITYYPYNKNGGVQPISLNGDWDRTDRTDMKPGRFAKLLTYGKLDTGLDCTVPIEDNKLDPYIEYMSNNLKSLGKLQFKISGKISEVYGIQEAADSETVTKSCMRPGSTHNCKTQAKFYDNIGGLKIIYGTNADNNLTFRALLWRLDNGKFLLDRVYGKKSNELYLHDLARERGWLWRNFSTDDPYIRENKNDKITYNATFTSNVNIKNRIIFSGVPYVDTLAHVEDYKIFRNKSTGKSMQVSSSEGRLSMTYGDTCKFCKTEHIDEDSAIDIYSYTKDSKLAYICEKCYPEYFRDCPHCGKKHYRNNMILVNGKYYCASCKDELFTYCTDCRKLILRSEIKQHSDKKLCSTCHTKYVKECNECGTFHSVSDLAKVGRRYICATCYQNYVICDKCGEKESPKKMRNHKDYTSKICTNCYNSLKVKTLNPIGYECM